MKTLEKKDRRRELGNAGFVKRRGGVENEGKQKLCFISNNCKSRVQGVMRCCRNSNRIWEM